MTLRPLFSRTVAALVALLFAMTLPFSSTFAASGSSTNAGKLARSVQATKRRSAGRVVRRKKARVASKRGSIKRKARKPRSTKKVARKRVRRTFHLNGSGRKASRKLRKSKRGVSSKKRWVVRSRKMVKVARGPVEPKLIKAAYSAIETGKLKTKAQFECIPDELKAVLGQVAAKWGTVTVNSSHRTRAHNRKVGGKRRSFHLKCQAADFSVAGSHRGIVAFLKKHPLVGGYKRYRAGHFHIDVGPKRTW